MPNLIVRLEPRHRSSTELTSTSGQSRSLVAPVTQCRVSAAADSRLGQHDRPPPVSAIPWGKVDLWLNMPAPVPTEPEDDRDDSPANPRRFVCPRCDRPCSCWNASHEVHASERHQKLEASDALRTDDERDLGQCRRLPALNVHAGAVQRFGSSRVPAMEGAWEPGKTVEPHADTASHASAAPGASVESP